MGIFVLISTGGDTWAVMHFQDKGRAIEATADKYAYARVKYSEERTTIRGLSEEDIATVKNKANAIIKKWGVIDDMGGGQ
jgi:NACalpha-BTF3-like transcription factor